MSALQLYRELFSAFKQANPKLNHSECDIQAGKLWKSLKENALQDPCSFTNSVKTEIRKLKEQFSCQKTGLKRYWETIQNSKPEAQSRSGIVLDFTTPPAKKALKKSVSINTKTKVNAPKQSEITAKLTSVICDIEYLEKRKANGLNFSEDDSARLKDLKAQRTDLEMKLKTLQTNQKSAQKKRANQKAALSELQAIDPNAVLLLKNRPKPGRPRLEETQPSLLKAIVDIAEYGCSADAKRRSEAIRTVKTLDDLLEELHKLGFQISRNALYIRLLPKRPNSTEGKRHVVTVPVRLQRATYDFHKFHCDTSFCKASIQRLEELASILGPEQVLFISQDDKARVPIGKTAANKEAPLVMHVEYLVRLPDHDWVVAERHKLIPSVYAIVEIKPDKICDNTAVGYSGPTFIRIRSGKHSSSTAFSHAKDMEDLLNHEKFATFVRGNDGKVKPVVMLIVDGGPDENPRYEKVQQAVIHHFKKQDLDAIFVATNAPGRSAFNRVERRMAPLSHELSGLILPHDHFGSHLNDQGKTVDKDLEIRNFRHAGEVLADIWNGLEIDGYETVANYVNPENSEIELDMSLDSKWREAHVREGHYFFQVIKCKNPECCKPFRGNIRKILPTFLPGPVFVDQKNGLSLTKDSEGLRFTNLLLHLQLGSVPGRSDGSREDPFDACCPSIQNILGARTCKHCGLYHASIKSLRAHVKTCALKHGVPPPEKNISLPQFQHRRPLRAAARRQRELMVLWSSRELNPEVEHVDWVDEDDLEEVEIQEEKTEDEPLIPIYNIDLHMSSVWEPDEGQS